MKSSFDIITPCKECRAAGQLLNLRSTMTFTSKFLKQEAMGILIQYHCMNARVSIVWAWAFLDNPGGGGWFPKLR